jgi:colanic acid/amylovoran biosynthesis glycosyltransferase
VDVVEDLALPSERFLARKVAAVAAAGVDVVALACASAERSQDFEGARVVPGSARAYLAVLGAMSLRHPLRTAALVRRGLGVFGVSKRSAEAILRANRLASLRPDVIHFGFSALGVLFLDALTLLRRPRVAVSCQGRSEMILPLTDVRWGPELRRLFERADAIHCVSGAMAARVVELGADPAKIVVIRHAVDADQLAEISAASAPTPGVVVTAARLSWEKGLDSALAAMAILRDRGREVRYRVLGGGDDRDRLIFLAARYRLEDRVEFLGFRNERETLTAVAGASVFLLPSLSEGISNAVLEAMALGTPVVSTDVGGMAEVVQDGVTGLLVPAGAPDEMAAAVASLLDDEARARSLSAEARRFVYEHHALRDQALQFAELYTRLVDGSQVGELRAAGRAG